MGRRLDPQAIPLWYVNAVGGVVQIMGYPVLEDDVRTGLLMANGKMASLGRTAYLTETEAVRAAYQRASEQIDHWLKVRESLASRVPGLREEKSEDDQGQ